MTESEPQPWIHLFAPLAAGALVTLALLALWSVFLRQHPRTDASLLAAPDPRCLAGVPANDVAPEPAFAGRWQVLDGRDCVPGSWLTRFHEPGQNLHRYESERRRLPNVNEPIEVLRRGPLWPQDAALADAVQEFVGVFFQRPTRGGDGGPLPAVAHDPERGPIGQYDAQAVLEDPGEACPREVGLCLSVTSADLHAHSAAYVFGLGHYQDRVGIMSFARMRASVLGASERRRAEAQDTLRRALKVAAHELGHELGVQHCLHYRQCLMAGSNSLDENDDSSMFLCPLDHRKLERALGWSAPERFAELASFALRHRLYSEAAYWREMAEATADGLSAGTE